MLENPTNISYKPKSVNHKINSCCKKKTEFEIVFFKSLRSYVVLADLPNFCVSGRASQTVSDHIPGS